MSEDPNRKRRQALEVSIRETLDLIRQYEDKRRLSDDPKEQRDSERKITDLRRLLEGYQAEVAELEKPSKPLRLPRDLPDFVDRDAEIERALSALRGFQAVGIYGLAGVGKTALATHVAWRLELDFPDGISWHFVQDATPESLIGDIATTFGEPTVRAIPDPYQRREAFRNLMGVKKALLFLDNVEHPGQVRELLDLAPRCAILITSRKHLALPKLAEVLDLESFTRDHARELFASRCRRELDSAEQAIADSICQRLGDLPLAIDLAAALASTGRVGRLQILLDKLQQGLFATLEGVRLAFEVSYSSLSETLQGLFNSLGVFSAKSFSEETASAIHGGQDVGELLGELVAQSLLQRVQDYGASVQPGLERYTLHPLLREFAVEHLVKTRQEGETRARHAEHFLELARDLGSRIQDTWDSMAWDRLDLDLPDLRAAMKWAAKSLRAGRLDRNWPTGILDAALAMGEYWKRRGYPDDWVDWSEKGIEAWGSLDRQEASMADLVKLWEHKGLALEFKGWFQEAAEAFRELWDMLGQTLGLTEEQTKLLDELPDPTPEADPSIIQPVINTSQIADPYYRDLAFACLHIGINELRMGQKDNSWMWAKRGYWFAAAGDVSLELARANHLLGILHRATRNLDPAIEHGERGLAILREQAILDPSAKAAILNSLGVAYRQRGDLEKAIECSREAKELEARLGNIINQAHCSTGLAEALREAAQYESAIAECEEAQATYRRVGHTEGEIASLMNLADIYLDQGKAEDALEIGQQMKQVFENSVRRQDIFRMGTAVYTVMARVLRVLGRESEVQDCEALAGEMGE